MTRSGITMLAAAAVAAAAGGWWLLAGPRADGPAGPADPDDTELVSLGARVYAQACASCHGSALEGQADWRVRRPDGTMPAPPHDASGHSWHHDDATLFTITKHGPAALAGAGYRSDMPAFGGTLSDTEIRATLAYIKSTWPAEVREKQAQINRQAKGQNR